VGQGGVGAVAGAPRGAPAHRPPVQQKIAGRRREPSDRLQGLARPVVPLRVSARRRLFGRLGLATQQRVERLLAWATWRRWHQGIANYWHDKRRAIS